MKLLNVGNIELENNEKYTTNEQIVDLLKNAKLPVKITFADVCFTQKSEKN